MKAVQLKREAIVFQLLAVVCAVLPHLSHLPIWIPILVVITLLWRMMAHLGRWSFPTRWMKLVIVVGTGLAVLFSYKAGGGISLTVSLLIVGFSLKTLEVYKQRDALIVLYVAYLVSATGFLFHQSIPVALYIIFSLSVITAGLLSVYQLRSVGIWPTFKRSSLMLLPALPLMVVLFVGMPRVGPLWEVGLDRSAARTGLSDSMSPGDISDLIRSPEVAFRASFDDIVPSQSQLYWRAMVLNDFDGREWFNSQGGARIGTSDFDTDTDTGSNILSYSIILEPTQKRYVPVLAYPIAGDTKKLTFRSDATVANTQPITTRQQFFLQSAPNHIYQFSLRGAQRERLLTLPKGNFQSIALARKWRLESDSEEELVIKILTSFNSQFSYSLKPPLLGENSVDEFLFETQVGFCGHFSSATALLLRAAGIPARVVTGYQGGDYNEYDNYITVRQYDAHAWVEAWYTGRGWVRIDPTAAVAPERIEQAAQELFAAEDDFLSDNPFYAMSLKSRGWLSQVRMRIDAINYGWHRWVLSYHYQQKNVLESILGAVTPFRLAVFLLLPFAFVIALTVGVLYKKDRDRLSHIFDREIGRLSDTLQKKGLARAKGETVNAYCQRLAEILPETESLLNKLANEYEQARYAESSQLSNQEFSHLVDCCIGAFTEG